MLDLRKFAKTVKHTYKIYMGSGKADGEEMLYGGYLRDTDMYEDSLDKYAQRLIKEMYDECMKYYEYAHEYRRHFEVFEKDADAEVDECVLSFDVTVTWDGKKNQDKLSDWSYYIPSREGESAWNSMTIDKLNKERENRKKMWSVFAYKGLFKDIELPDKYKYVKTVEDLEPWFKKYAAERMKEESDDFIVITIVMYRGEERKEYDMSGMLWRDDITVSYNAK